MPHTAFIVDCCRTASGKRNGALREYHPADLGAKVVDELVSRTGIKGQDIDDVIFGCVSQIGCQAGNIARNIVLASKELPISVPGTTVDRQCGSGQQALHFACMAVKSGVQDVVVCGGVECMTQVPIGSNITDGLANNRGFPFSAKGIQQKYPNVMFSQFEGAELLAKKHGISRNDLDNFGLASQQKALKAQKDQKFKNEIVSVKGLDKQGNEIDFAQDEGVRSGVSLEKMKSLKTLKKDGLMTAATSSQIADGASAILICNEQGLKKLGLKPRAKVIGLALAGDDPVVMLGGPIPATKNVFKQTGLSMRDIDLYEVNEAFASVPLAWAKALNADLSKLNVNGGACALGHPLGSTGTKLMTTLVNELEKSGKKYGLQAICEGGGTANATIIEIVPKSNL